MEATVMAEILTTMKSNVTEDSRSNKSSEGSKAQNEVDIYNGHYPPMQFVWRNILAFLFLHTLSVYAIFEFLSGQIMWQTFIFSFFVTLYGGFGITGGCHRLWAHKCYKAKLPLRIFLMIAQTVAMQNSIWEWSRDHRVHHKYTETLADPHNAKRGFFFAHIGWLTVRKHPAVIEKGKKIDMSDLDADPVVAFQKKHYLLMAPLFGLVIPSVLPWYFWGQHWWSSYCFAGIFRYLLSLHITWTLNSVAHTWGTKPYDKNIGPVEVYWSFFTIGEEWHNYHHTFPWDYRAAEFGGIIKASLSTVIIDQFAKIGWAYDLKTVPKNIVEQRIKRTGDGTHPVSHGQQGHAEKGTCAWGWGDVDIPPENVVGTQTLWAKKSN